MGLAVVNEHRQVPFDSEGELPVEDRALDVRRRQVAVVVEPDLADRACPRFRSQAFEVRPARFVERRGVVWVDADGGVDQLRVTVRQIQRGLG